VNLIGGPGRPTVKWREFFQCGMETTSLVNVALTEMMLQSNEDAIRVFPAVPEAWKKAPLAFKLLARGGFLVAAERRSGAVVKVAIKSLNGGECRIRNPFTDGAPVVRDAAGSPVETRPGPGGAITFATTPGSEYTLLPADAKTDAAPTVFKSDQNKGPKTLEGGPKRRMLGLEPVMR
jgi:alpha-L-fucosidase 2